MEARGNKKKTLFHNVKGQKPFPTKLRCSELQKKQIVIETREKQRCSELWKKQIVTETREEQSCKQ